MNQPHDPTRPSTVDAADELRKECQLNGAGPYAAEQPSTPAAALVQSCAKCGRTSTVVALAESCPFCDGAAPAVPEGVDTAELPEGKYYDTPAGPEIRFTSKQMLAYGAQQREAGRREYKPWYDAVTDACIVSGELPWDENDARQSVANLIAWREDVALDPHVSDRAAALATTELPEPAYSRSGSYGVMRENAYTVKQMQAFGAQQREAGRRDMHETNVVLVNDICKLSEKLGKAEAEISKLNARALRVATCAGEFARDAARCQPVSAPDDNDRLKSCPHCGGHAEIDQSESGGYYIECLVCGASTQLIFATGDDPVPLLMERWNKRIRPAEPVSELTDEQAWKWSKFEDWLASPITPPGSQIEYTRLAFNSGRALLAASPAKVEPTGRMATEQRRWIEGMSVSLDVSTGEHDADHRYYGVVSEVMDCDGDKHGVTLLVYDAKPNFEPVSDDKRDAELWRGLIGSARFKVQGSAGLREPQPNNYAHMGLEMWTTYGRDYSPELLKRMDYDNAVGREWLTKYAEIGAAAIAATPLQPQPETKNA